ncbi:hypothetical protein ABMX48_12385 [Streptomyces cavourensis]
MSSEHVENAHKARNVSGDVSGARSPTALAARTAPTGTAMPRWR